MPIIAPCQNLILVYAGSIVNLLCLFYRVTPHNTPIGSESCGRAAGLVTGDLTGAEAMRAVEIRGVDNGRFVIEWLFRYNAETERLEATGRRPSWG